MTPAWTPVVQYPAARPPVARPPYQARPVPPHQERGTGRYPPGVLGAWQASQRGALPALSCAWRHLHRTQQAQLQALGCTSASWDAARVGREAELPAPFRCRFAALTPTHQACVLRLGIDRAAWDGLVALRQAVFAVPALSAVFEQHVKTGVPIDALAVEALLDAAGVRMPFGSRTGQRALAALRDRFATRFTAEARARLSAVINERVPFVFSAHGWNTSVVPRPSAAEQRRVRRGGAPWVNDAGGMAAALCPERVTPHSVEALQEELLRAHHMGWQVNVAGARHSQGGQSCIGGTLQIDMAALHRVDPQADDTVWAQAGATWHDVIAALRGSGRTVQIMQASHIFSVGGSIAVNCHGRTADDGPLVTSLLALRVLLPSGEHVTCSRTHRRELFFHVVGGYGMAGIVTAAQFKTVPDNYLSTQSTHQSLSQLPAQFAAAITDSEVEIAYARIDPTSGNDSTLTVARRTEPPVAQQAPQVDFERLGLTLLERVIFTISKWGRAMLALRWWLERKLRSAPSQGYRSDLLDLNADGLAQLPWREGRRTDFLEELFIPFDARAEGAAAIERDQRFLDFTRALRALQRQHRWSSLNITVRHVRADAETVMSYARQDSVAFVLYYNQRVLAQDAIRRAALQRDLAALALRFGGKMYLPYLQCFGAEQVQQAYPGLASLLAYKKKVDPHNLLARTLGP